MISKATARFIRISPRKVRQVADLIRGKNVGEALALLSNLNKSATVYLEEVLQSAANNAKNKQPDINQRELRITKLTVDGGPTMVRYRAASMGRASMIRKRTSHINVELFIEDEEKQTKKKRRAKSEKRKT